MKLVDKLILTAEDSLTKDTENDSKISGLPAFTYLQEKVEKITSQESRVKFFFEGT